jgi:hypothetical protein
MIEGFQMALDARVDFARTQKDEQAVLLAYEKYRNDCRRILDVERNRLLAGTGDSPSVDLAGYAVAYAEEQLADLKNAATPTEKK